MPTIEALEAALHALQEEVRALRARLDGEPRRGLMRDTLRCPACSGRRILLIDWLQNIQADAERLKAPIAVTIKTRFTGIEYRGILKAFACAGCGHTEIQLEDPAALEAGANVRILDPAEGSGPYR